MGAGRSPGLPGLEAGAFFAGRRLRVVAVDRPVACGAMHWTDAYATTRQRLLAQAETLDDHAANAAVPALPGWSVKDAYAHLTGVCADVLDGNMDGGGTPAWTARQVAARAERPLVAVCAE